jgi:beta/gamma crystallin
MNANLRYVLALAGFAISMQAGAQVTLYENGRFRGQSVTVDRPTGNLERQGFNNRASSAVVNGEPWEVCDGPGFSGRCTVLNPGRHQSLRDMNDGITSLRPVSARGGPVAGAPPPAPAGGGQLTLYERRDFRGASINIDRPRRRLERADFANVASSAVVRGEPWEVCDGEEFGGRCVVLRPGRYGSLDSVGMNNRIASARPAGAGAPPPGPGPGPAVGQVTLYEHSGFRGQSVTVDRPRRNLDRIGAGNAASSVVVAGEPWELCDGPGFSGRCVVLRPGRYTSLGSMGLNDAVSSLRPVQR